MACKESICRNCFHSYVCEQFNENKDDNNEKCHFANDHYISRTDVVPKSEVEKIFKEFERLMENNEVWFRQTDEIREEFAELKKKYTEN